MTVYNDDANLQALWYLDEVSGVRFDFSPNGNDLTDNNTVGSSTDKKQGERSASFVRANSEYLSISNAAQTGLGITGSMSVACWVKLATLPGDEMIPVCKYLANVHQRSYRLQVSIPGKVEFTLSTDGNVNTFTATGNTVLSTGVWYHLSGVYNGTDIRVYVNGALDSNGADNPKVYSGGVFNGTGPVEIGRRSAADYLDGLLDEVAIFDRALSAGEVASIHTEGIIDPVSPPSQESNAGVIIKIRGDTQANWLAVNPVLVEREIGLELDSKRFKVGTGLDAWDVLEYWLQGANNAIVGEIRALAHATVPTGWLLCDGSEVSRAAYAVLYAAVGDLWGNGNGTTTFNLPPANIFLLGSGENAVGDTGGQKTVTLTTDQMPTHDHGFKPSGAWVRSQSDGGSLNLSASAGGNNVNITTETALAGGGANHTNMPPYGVVAMIIYTGA